MRYLRFFAENRRFLAFGLLLTFASSFGQTFFIALFGADTRADLGLSHGELGAIYSAATLASGLLFLWAGASVDRYDLRVVTVFACAGLSAAALGHAAATTIPILLISFFGLRLTGQGLLSHLAATSMARYFEGGPGGSRGRALSIASLGHPAGEAIFPALGVAAIAALGWRQTWLAVAAAVAAVVIPLALWLLRGHGIRHQRMLARAAQIDHEALRPSWRRRDVLRDYRLYLVLPAVLAPAFINTGVFFHQVHIVEEKGWSMGEFAAAFTVYALTSVASALAAGGLVDRLGALRLLPAVLVPLGVGLSVMAAASHVAVAFFYMAAAGVTQGANATVVNAVWAERYGIRYLGAIRALAQSLMVLSTALAPYTLGALIDANVSAEALFPLLLACVVAAIAVVIPGSRLGPSARAQSALQRADASGSQLS